MLQMNGKGNQHMTAPAPKPPEPGPNDVINMVGLRLWLLCAMIIIGFGVANYVLNWVLGP